MLGLDHVRIAGAKPWPSGLDARSVRLGGDGQRWKLGQIGEHVARAGVDVQEPSSVGDPFADTVEVTPAGSFLGGPAVQSAEVPGVRRGGRRLLQELIEVVDHHLSLAPEPPITRSRIRAIPYEAAQRMARTRP